MRVSDPHLQQRLDLPDFMTMKLNEKSRDEMMKFIAGLRAVYADAAVRGEILELIRKDVVGSASMDQGRLGLSLWAVFVLVAAKTALNRDFDALEDLAENHRLLRIAMGFGDFQSGVVIEWQRIWSNVRRVSPTTLNAINARVLHVGHSHIPTAAVTMRADSFVMKTNIHHPSDIRQVDDALRCVLRHGVRLCDLTGSSQLRQHKHLHKRQRQLVLRAGLALSSRGRGHEDRVIAAATNLCDFADERLHQALDIFEQSASHSDEQVRSERSALMRYCTALQTVIHVARARLIKDETVPLSDRLLSIFEAHSECIHRGKARAAVEFGHRCLIVEDSAGFIVHSHVMANGRQDRDVTATVTRLLKRQFPKLEGISFDRGFHSPENQQRLATILPGSCLPTTGIHAAAQQKSTATRQWKKLRRNHPGIEAAIGNLQKNHGCEICPNKGRNGYARHLATAVMSANLITLGRIIIAKEHPDSNAAHSNRQPPPLAA